MLLSKNDIIKYECYKYDHQAVKYNLNQKVKGDGSWFGVTVDIYTGDTLIFVHEVLDAQTLRSTYEQIKYCRQVLGRWKRFEVVGCTPTDVQSANDMAEYLMKLESKAGFYYSLSLKFLTDDEVKQFKTFAQGSTLKPKSNQQEVLGNSQDFKMDRDLIKTLVGIGLITFGCAWMFVATHIQPSIDNQSKVEQAKQ